MGNWNQLTLLLIVCLDNNQLAVGLLSACFYYNGDCLRQDSVKFNHSSAEELCTSNGGNLLSISSNEMDYVDRHTVLLSNSVNFPFWLDCKWSEGARRSGGMVFYGPGNPGNTGVWRWTRDPEEDDKRLCVTMLSSGEISLTECEEVHTVICASNWSTIVDTSTTPPSTSSITTIATTLEVETTSRPESTTIFTTTDTSTEDTSKSTSPTTTSITISDTTTKTTVMTTASSSTDQTTKLWETSEMTTDMTSSCHKTDAQPTSPELPFLDAQPTSPELSSLYVVKPIGGCLSTPDVVSTSVGSLLQCGIRCHIHENSQSGMNRTRCASFNFYGLKSGIYFCELNFRRFDSDTDTVTNHNDCFYYERG